MRTASQIKTAIVISIVLLLGTNIMLHVAEEKAKQKYDAPGKYILYPEALTYLFSYMNILYGCVLYGMVHKNFENKSTKTMIKGIAIPAILLSIVNIMKLGLGASGKTLTPEGQMIVSAMSIQIVVCFGMMGYIYSGMRN